MVGNDRRAVLRALGQETAAWIARERFGRDLDALAESEPNAVGAEVPRLLKQNRYDPERRVLVFTEPEALSYKRQIRMWAEYFSHPARNLGLPAAYIRDVDEVQRLTAFFAWTAWASVAPRPGRAYSYTNNFPYDPAVGNTPTSAVVLWSALSLIALLDGLAVVLFLFGVVGFFMMGFAYQAFPRFKHTSLWGPTLVMAAGIALQAGAHLLAPRGSFLALGLLAEVLQLLATALFAHYNMIR